MQSTQNTQNLFSVAWSKFASWFQVPEAPPQSDLQEDFTEADESYHRDLSAIFSDRVDPSLYYTIFSSYRD